MNALCQPLPDGNQNTVSPKLPAHHSELSHCEIKTELCHENPSLCNVNEQSEDNDCSVNFPERSVLMGSFHQGHSRFGNVRNKQCGAISLTAVLKSKTKNVWTWDTGDLDDVLIKGTGLYRSMSAQGRIQDSVARRGYIAVSELPKQQRMWNCNFAIHFAESYTGFVNVDDYDHALHDVAMPFDEALQRALFGNDACLLTVCASTCAIVNEGGRFAFVDSHASTKVNQQGERASCVAYVSSVQYLVSFVYDYARSFHVTTPSFEVTGVKVVSDGSTDTRAQMTEPSSSHVTTNTTNSRPLYSKVVTDNSILYRDTITDDRAIVQSRDHNKYHAQPPAVQPSGKSKKMNGERKFGKQQSSVGGPTKVARNVNIVNNKPASSVNVNADPNVNRCLDATDDVIVSNVTIAKQPFKPLTRQDRDDLCKKLGLSNENADKDQTIAAVDDMGCPCKIKSIKPDGNCFYRSLAFSVCHDEEKHLKIRRAVVRHLQNNSGKFDKYLRNEYTSVQDYVTTSRIYYCGSWATEIDIFAAADLLQTTIFTLNDGKWNMHRPTTLSQSCLQNCIYLNHTGNHYEVVTCVKSTDRRRSCAGMCRPMKSDDKPRSQRKRKLICESENVHAKKERLRYHNKYKDVRIKQAKRESSRKHFENQYRSNPQFQKYKLAYFLTKYHTNAKYQILKRDSSKRTYGNNLSFQTRVREYSKVKYNTNKTFQSDVRDYSKAKYKTNTKFQTLVRCYSKDKYKTNTKFQTLVRCYSKDKYKTNTKFQTLVRCYSKDKYKTNTKFQTLVRCYSKDKYKTNTKFQTLVRCYSKDKYKTNTKFQTLVRCHSKDKYKTNMQFQTLVRDYSRLKYKNISFQNKIKKDNKTKYRNNKNIRVNKIKQGCESYAKWQKKQEDVNCAIAYFRGEVSRGPEYVCSVCHRLLFRKQVVECKTQSYESKRAEVAALAKRCITLKYLHVCDTECDQGCSMSDSPSSKLWICYTCHRKILAGKLPDQSVTNNMHLDEIPAELKCLNSLEQHLIARHVPFMKLLCLPRGRQRACHGPCVSVPVNTTDVTNLLPRNECDDKMIRVKLKRKLTYKGHYEYMYVRTDQVRNALRYLMANNKWYDDVTWNNEWVNTLNGTDEDQEQNINQEEAVNSDDDNAAEGQAEEELTYVKDQSGLLSDTSLQPVDLGSEIVDQNFQDILNVAPGEGNSPVRLLSDKTNEAKCFPVLYPLGGPTFHDERESKITLARYLNTRILNADGRFARNTDFIFYAQYISEVYQVVSSVSVALRKGGNSSLKQASPDMFLKPESLSKIFCNDEGYKFLRGIRGTPPYWMSVQKDLFAMVRQLSIPTFFASFSSADLRWPEMLNSILRVEGKKTCVDDLDWADKCGLLRRNPVTAARLFDHRWHCFLKDVILSKSQPIGKVIDYFYRVEFQQRGSPHVHCLFWVENAPRLDRDTDAEVARFIDTYITCETPPEADAELYDIVNTVQKHSMRHSKTCRKKNTVCRFNFPRPPSSRTFITRSVNSEDSIGEHDIANASEIMKKVKTALTKPDMNFDSTDAFFKSLEINQAVFEKAYNICSKKKSIVLKRNVTDIWVNQYNEDLLRAWNGNMDIQYVTDAFSVVVYILSYITKAEQEMGLLLQRAQNEAMNGNLDAKSAFKQLGSVYLHNREVSAQEAVYRLTHMHLKECSRDVQFIPVGENLVRMSLPLHMLQAKAQQEHCDDESSIWMTNVVERYTVRTDLTQHCVMNYALPVSVLNTEFFQSRKCPL
ncbi:OTU domain-containing protein 4 [Merluccius polli]|uniref:OTU domain-containing protein 4 n=1 Tax=Merluccius polli TaxID=89951 RepID=A0AA47M6Z2_MERPO|nr:OTU domain-containing protein 4 [Merluccius polli]